MAALTLAVLALCPGVAHAAAGELDPSFSGDGRQVLPSNIRPNDVLVQSDGKIVVTDSESFKVMRLRTDGSLDPSFGGDGIAAADFTGGRSITSAALQPDGKLIVAGWTASFEIAIARFKENGELDPTFDPGGPDGDGRKVYGYGSLAPQLAAVTLVQPDGRIVIAGPSALGMTASRLTPSGAPDGTEFEYAHVDREDETVTSAALAPDGAIVLGGYARTYDHPDHYESTVARFGTDGSLDKSLAGTGITKFSPDEHFNSPTDLLVQPDGKIVVVADSGTAEDKLTVTRLSTTGTPDGTFGAGGTTTPDFAGDDASAGAALQPDGKIIVAASTGPEYDFAAARLDSRGALDPSFGSGGKTTVAFEGPAAANAAALQPDGKFVIAGVTAVENNTSVRTAVVRLQADAPPSTGGGGGPTGGPGPGGAPHQDVDPPVIGRLSLTRRTFAVARGATALAAAAKGTVIRYSLSEAAQVTVQFQRARIGRRVGGRCRPIGARTRPSSVCRRYVTVGTLHRTGALGPNRVSFSGRIGRRALRPAGYRVRVRAVDAAGNRSGWRSRGFRVVRGPAATRGEVSK